jgi:four helix bundle protein
MGWPSHKQIIMNKIQNSKQYDLEDRTLEFAKQVRDFARKVQKDIGNFDDLKQLIRSSGSVGANYIEANEALSKKDFVYRIKICRKESKESKYWLRLVDTNGEPSLEQEQKELIQEATELVKISGSIVTKNE